MFGVQSDSKFLVTGGFDIKTPRLHPYLIVQMGFRQKSLRTQQKLHLLWLSVARGSPQELMGWRGSCCSCGQGNKSDEGKGHKDRKKYGGVKWQLYFSNQEQEIGFSHFYK